MHVNFKIKGKNFIINIIPIALIFIFLVIIGIFLALDERWKSVNLDSEQGDIEGEQGLFREIYFADFIQSIILRYPGSDQENIFSYHFPNIPKTPSEHYYNVFENESNTALVLEITLKDDWEGRYDEVLVDWLYVEGIEVKGSLNSGRSRLVNLSPLGVMPVTISIDGLPTITLLPLKWEAHLSKRPFTELITGYRLHHLDENQYSINSIINERQLANLGSTDTKAYAFHRKGHGDRLELTFTLKYGWYKAFEERLNDWVKVTGAEFEWDEPSTNYYGDPTITVVFSHLEPKIEVNISGLPQLILREEHYPLNYSLKENGDNPTYLMYDQRAYPRSSIILKQNTESVDLVFSEQMIVGDQLGSRWQADSSINGEWVALDTYRIYPTPLNKEINLEGLYSLSGNYPGYNDKLIDFVWKQDTSWIDSNTGKVFAGSKNAPLYDALLASPDGRYYIGIHKELVTDVLYGPIKPYHIFLEMDNGESELIMSSVHSHALDNGYPVSWVDSNQFLIYSNKVVYLYNIKEQKLKELFHTEKDTSIFSASLDKNKQMLHFYVMHEPKPYYMLTETSVDYYILDVATGKVMEKHIEFSLLDARIFTDESGHHVSAHKLGIFHSINTEEGNYTTWTKPDGRKTQLEGLVVHAFDKGVLLLNLEERLSSPQEHRMKYWHEHAWWIGLDGKVVELDHIKSSNYYRFGDHLLRFSFPDGPFNNKLEILNQRTLEWHELERGDWSLLNKYYPILFASPPYIREEHLPLLQEILKLLD